jgi:pseudaminic acid synthase
VISIAGRQIGTHARPYLIAEMSGNHNQSIDRALAIVDAAAEAGADAVKLQTYTAQTMTLQLSTPGFIVNDPSSLWCGRQLYDLYKEAHTPWEWHKPIMDRARHHGMECFSTPFDASAVDFLESLGVSAYKIASFECTDLPLIRKVASTGKPMLISVGMASLAEIDNAVTTARHGGCRDLVLLKCTSTYPATPENTNVRTIAHMQGAFGCDVGLSDHTMGLGAAIAAIALGAVLIEKHFTTCRADGGVDAAFSMEPHEFKALRDESERAWQSLGQIQYGISQIERKSLQFRRSLYVVENISTGERLTQKNVRAIRPGLGMPPEHLEHVLGLTAVRDIPRGTPLDWHLLK